MNNDQRMQLLRTVFSTIFQSKRASTDITQIRLTTNTGQWPGRWFKDSSTGQLSLRGFDFTCNLGDRIISLRCLEQNPNKTDNFGNLKKFANLARQGHQIMWVIDKNKAVDGFLGRMHNGEWHASFQPATQPALPYQQPAQPNAQNAAVAQTVPMNIEELPEIPNNIGIPDYILQQVADMDEPPEWENWGEQYE